VILKQYGFSDRFLHWLVVLLCSANTRMMIWHWRGLCQGDPLSPQICVLAVDALGRLIQRAVDMGVLQQLHLRHTIPSISLYADDVILFCQPTIVEAMAVKEILRLFGEASGLHVNYAKSSATLINCGEIDCPVTELPFSYLGITRTIRRPAAAQMQPLVDRMAARLPTWKSRLMQKPGRLVLVKSVLGATPIHQLLVLAPPKKTIRLMEKIERGFLREGRAAANGRSCHVNWRRVCQPTSIGGAGSPGPGGHRHCARDGSG
jgi:hypothetical protein